ncbi:hypothetical protein [Phenylobacterium sp.]|uniref:hypothetical protein n=1 Tax=Phenylobacterium sp. TaxID=1871053 RepID=UPI002FDA2E27
MGLRLNWLAVKTEQREALLACLGLELAGEVSSEVGEGLVMAELPSGWLVLVDDPADRELLAELSRVSEACGEALGAEVHDTVSFSRAQAYRDGQLQWSLASETDGDGFVVLGELPAAPAEADGYEAPLALAESLCGYRAGEMVGLEWLRVAPRGASRSAAPGRSLREAMRAELLPLLEDLGWSFPPDPALAETGVITRQIDGRAQTLWFEYSSGGTPQIDVRFQSVETQEDGPLCIEGRVGEARAKLPFWRRFSWKALREATSYPPASADPIGAAIAQAREEIAVADAYLRGGFTDNRIYITGRWRQRA